MDPTKRQNNRMKQIDYSALYINQNADFPKQELIFISWDLTVNSPFSKTEKLASADKHFFTWGNFMSDARYLYNSWHLTGNFPVM